MAKLGGLSGAEFDKAYIDNEVAYHEAVIKVVTGTLIPNTKNAELKKLLESAGRSSTRTSPTPKRCRVLYTNVIYRQSDARNRPSLTGRTIRD